MNRFRSTSRSVSSQSHSTSISRRPSWIAQRIQTFNRFHDSIPVKYKIPIILISTYVLILVLALVLIGIILAVILDRFEEELTVQGFGGFSELHQMNVTSFRDWSYLNEITITDIDLPGQEQKDLVASIVDGVNINLKGSMGYIKGISDVNHNISVTIDQLGPGFNGTRLTNLSQSVSEMHKDLTPVEGDYDQVNKFIQNKTALNQHVYNILVPIGSQYLQCSSFGPGSPGWPSLGAQWTIHSNVTSYVRLANGTTPIPPSKDVDPITILNNTYFGFTKVTGNNPGPNTLTFSDSCTTTHPNGLTIYSDWKFNPNHVFKPPTVYCHLYTRTS